MTAGTTEGLPVGPLPTDGGTDPVLGRIADGVGLRVQARRDEARTLLLEVWDELGGGGDPLHRCAAAHALAGVQDGPDAELEWHLRALLAADQVSERGTAHPSGVLPASLYPSLHLNLADVHHRLGNDDRARLHLQLGRSALTGTPDDDATSVLRDGLDRVETRLDGAAPA